jgi:tetratricopeptide (TPR) repeat protein
MTRLGPERERVERALALFQGGDLPRAAALCREILATDPRQFEALHFLGLIAGRQKDFARAVEFLERALAVDDNQAGAHCNLGLARQELGRMEGALASYERALALQPDFAAAHLRRGNVLRHLRRLQDALAAYERAIACHAAYAEAHFNRANLLKELSQGETALAAYDTAIAIKPEYVEARVNRSQLLQELGCPAEALTGVEAALAMRPNDLPARLLQGNILTQLGQSAAALQSFDRAIALRNDHALAHMGRGNALRQLNRLTEALASQTQAIALDPDLAAAHVNRGNVLTDLGRHVEASSSYDRAIALQGDLAEAHFARAIGLLQLGDFGNGWREYEWRWKSPGTAAMLSEPRTFSQALWLGDFPLAGRTILLHGEQGLGDRIQFCRYVAGVAALGARVILEVPEVLAGLLGRLPGVGELVVAGSALPQFDCHCPLMSLPLAFASRLETIPATVPYLEADPAVTARWRARLGPRTRPRVGLAWSGNPKNANDRNRSIPLATLIARLPRGFDYVSLHREVRESDAVLLQASKVIGDFRAEQSDFSDAAALCELMDVVISADTSLAHLSGALGRPTWMPLAFNADWRWLVGRADSPWYPTVKLYRQTQLGDWDAVLQRVAQDLRRHFGTKHEREASA